MTYVVPRSAWDMRRRVSASNGETGARVSWRQITGR